MVVNVVSPFVRNTDLSLVALTGLRAGYIQLATTTEVTTYAELPPAMWAAAQAWCVYLEALGAQRIYWLTLSEQVRHLHIHLYPRWPVDSLLGLALFEQRHHPDQPEWTEPVRHALADWALRYQVLVDTP
ncbi:MAG: hypothetical protein SFZ03_06010 [Candidatus Melainabacteria bacterium]|nr:hypothetical protein [Candidatus Melainabacteria bacterium]